MRRLMLIVLLGAMVSGCVATGNGPNGALNQAKAAYAAGQYEAAYRYAASQVHGSNSASMQAAYLAGLSAQKLRRFEDAERYLRIATASSDGNLANDALVSLGLLYAEHGKHAQAAATLLAAAPRLAGDSRAQAYLHAALAQQKLGQFAQARTNLSLAYSATTDTALREQIQDLMSTTGYTIQVGAFSDAARAQAAAQAVSAKAAQIKLGHPMLAPRTDSTGRTLTAVQIGSFATFDAANRAKAQLGENGAVIVPLSR